MNDTIKQWIQDSELIFDYDIIDTDLVLYSDITKSWSTKPSRYWFPYGLTETSYPDIDQEKFDLYSSDYNDGKYYICLAQKLDFTRTISQRGYVFVDTQGNIICPGKNSLNEDRIYIKSSLHTSGTSIVRYFVSNYKNPTPKMNDIITEEESRDLEELRKEIEVELRTDMSDPTIQRLVFKKDRVPVTGVVYDLDENIIYYYDRGIIRNSNLSFPILNVKEVPVVSKEEDIEVIDKIGPISYLAFVLPGTIVSFPGLNDTNEHIINKVYTYIYRLYNLDNKPETSADTDPVETYLDIIPYIVCKESNYIKIYTEEGYLLNAHDYLPKFLKDSYIMTDIMDLYNKLLEKGSEVFGEIRQSYEDLIYKIKDYSRLSIGAKLEIIHELGFDYILDILPLNDEQLTKLVTFFNLIYMLKGKKEGLNICLSLLDIPYTYTVWDETEPKGLRFTAKLTIVGNEYSDGTTFGKLKDFVRAYMLPWIDIIIEVTSDPIYLYIQPIWGGILRVIDVYRYHKAYLTIPYLKVKDIDTNQTQTKVVLQDGEQILALVNEDQSLTNIKIHDFTNT